MLENFKRVAMHSLRLGVKDLLVFARDRMMLISFIIMPIFMMVMMGFIFPSQNALKNAPLGIVNLDEGSLGAQINSAIQQLNRQQSDRMFAITYLRNKGTAVEQIKKQIINGAIIIPADFSAKIAASEQVSIVILTDQSNPQVSAQIGGVLDNLMSAMSTQLAASNIASLVPVCPLRDDSQAIYCGDRRGSSGKAQLLRVHGARANGNEHHDGGDDRPGRLYLERAGAGDTGWHSVGSH